MSSPAVQPRVRLRPWETAAPEPRPALRVVPRRQVRAPRVPFVALVSAIMLGGVVGLLMFNTSMQQSSFAATALEEQATNLTARQQTLQRELEALRDPQRVARAAQRLGMVTPPAPAFLDLGTGKVTGEPVPATRDLALRLDPRPPAPPAELSPAPDVTVVAAPEGVLPEDGRRDDRARDARTARNSQADTGPGSAAPARRDGRNGTDRPQHHQSQQSQSQQGPRAGHR